MSDYKSLKKKLRGDFRLIRRSVKNGNLPPSEAVESFLAGAAKMVTFPGKGDEHYSEFSEAVARFRGAWESQNIGLLQSSAAELKAIRNACHERYK
jgi:XXXCH domain-containing protein